MSESKVAFGFVDALAANPYSMLRLYPFVTAVIYSVICALMQRFIAVVSNKLIPGFLELNPKIKATWYNKGVSSIHAVTMISLTAYYWIYFFEPSFNFMSSSPSRPNLDTDGFEARVVYIMMGYIMYDTYYEVAESPNPTDTAIILHHVIGFLSHSSTLLSGSRAALFYCMVIYIAEISTPFLNISWLLHNLGRDGSPLFLACSVTLLVTFSIRTLVGPYALYHMRRHREDWGDYFGGDRITRFMFDGNFLVISFFSALNFFWFYKLLLMAFGSKTKKQKSK